MYIKAASYRSVNFWEKHLKDEIENDRAQIIDSRGLVADDLRHMMLEMKDDAALTRCQNFMYIAIFNPCEDERLSEKEWEQAYEIFEKHRGIPEGQQRIVVEHEKKGRIHRHVVWNRIDLENMRAFPDDYDLVPCEAAEIEIERELGLRRTPNFLNRDPGAPEVTRSPKPWEMLRGMKTGLDARDVGQEVTAIFRDSKNAAEFVQSLSEHGYEFVQGKRAFCILDAAGNEHSLARRLDGVNTKQLRAFMEGFDFSDIPTVEEGRRRFHERQDAEQQMDRDTVRHEIHWEEALAKAAIEKEAAAQQFIEHEQLHERPIPAVEITPDRNEIAADRKTVQDEIDWEEALAKAAIAKEDAAEQFLEHEQLHQGHIHAAETAADRQTVRDEIDWEEALAKAAIQKEKIAREFVEKPGPREKPKPSPEQYQRPPVPASNLGNVDGDIRMAYSLTGSNAAFIGALDERGYLFARVAASDLEKLDQLEKERLERFPRKKSQEPQPWMRETGGVDKLSPEHRKSAQRNYDAWKPEYKKLYDFENYVSYVQAQQAKKPTPEQKPKPRFREGDFAVITPYGDVYPLTRRNTGDGLEKRTERFKDIDPARLPSVRDARITMGERYQQRLDEKRAAANEQHWPIHPPPNKRTKTSPEYHFADVARETTIPGAATISPEHLRGTSAKIWNAYNVREWERKDGKIAHLKADRDPNQFAAKLADDGIALAVVTKAEADKSHTLAAFAKEVGNFAPTYREGEIVAISPSAHVYKINERSTGEKRQELERFFTRFDRTQLQSIEGTKQIMHERAEERAAVTKLFAAINPVIKQTRKPYKGNKVGQEQTAASKIKIHRVGHVLGKTVDRTLDVGLSAFEGLFAPTLTPAQRSYGEKATRLRHAEGEERNETAAILADIAAQRQERESEREAARERERGRDR